VAYFLGLDLAWGANAWTGVAVLDESGRLLEMDRVRTDAEIEQRLRPYLDGPVVLGIDAPLIVRNESGRRPCESQISRVFGRFHAGAHSSNLSISSFRNGPRGGAVAAMLGLDVDPAFAPRSDVRRAIEVYPHPATITLFGLDRVLPYKAKPGRSPVSRREAFVALMERTAGLASADPPLTVRGCAAWERARAVVHVAATHRELNELEDALDAVLCAYVARHRWEHGDAESAVFGDVETGYIVVPLDDRVREAADGGSEPSARRDAARPTTVLVPAEDLATLDEYAQVARLSSRAAALRHAVGLLRSSLDNHGATERFD
jgi:predicted RNase H-like nuclease